MKKSLVITACATLLAGAMAWGANPVYSVNGVGYETFDLVGGQRYMMRIDFEKMNGGAWTLSDIFGTNSAMPMTVYYYIPGFGWQGENWLPDDQIWDPGIKTFTRGDSMFVRMFGTGDLTNKVTISGEIPGANNGATNAAIWLASGFNGVGYSYPSAIALTNTTLSTAANGQPVTVYYWVNGGWQGVNWLPDDGIWDPDNFVMQPGQGYLIKMFGAGSNKWVEAKPYSWP